MLSFNIKEFFQERAYDILVLLFIIHIGSLVCSVVIQWLHPYLKNYVRMNDKNATRNIVGFESEEIINESDSESSDEYCHLIENLKSFVDVSGIPLEVLGKVNDKYHVLNDLTCGIGKGPQLRKNIKNALDEQSLSRETQTNVTISPKVEIDYSCPQIILATRKEIHNSISSDEYESANSETSVDVQEMPKQLFCKVSSVEIRRKSPSNIFTDFSTPYSEMLRKHIIVKSDISKTINNEYREKIHHENRILETAISDFEKELAPIKEQIKVLKQSFNDYISSSDSSLPSTPLSATSCSIAGTESIGHCNALNTTYSTDLSTCFSRNLVDRKGPFVIEVKLNNLDSPSVRKLVTLNQKNENCLVSDRNLGSHKDNSTKSLSQFKQKKRSPIAEMYVKLSQSNFQSHSLSKETRKTISKTEDGNTVTYHINLNLNVGNLLSNNRGSYSIKERDLLPILSDLSDIIGQPSHTHISLKPAKSK